MICLNQGLQIHEVIISSDGETKSNDLPSDIYYENVKIRESRRPKRVEAVAIELEEDVDTEDDSDD